MAASDATVRGIIDAIRRHVDQATLGRIITDLLRVPGNKSFRDTIIKLKRRMSVTRQTHHHRGTEAAEEATKAGITGRGPMRDRYILCNALAYAILVIERLPIERREASNRQDMMIMLDHLAADFLGVDHFMKGAEHHLNDEVWK